jgi:hypothetical protein
MELLIIGLIMLVASFVIQSFLIKRPKVEPASLEDFEFPQMEEGTAEFVVFGDGWTDGPMILYHGGYRTKKIKAAGKKG